MKDPHLISVDELRAAGALDVPASWRKSLGEEERDLFSGLFDEEESRSDEKQSLTDESNSNAA
ncbi:MAG: hypothetical protein QM703_02400 [Gemmatales bacterium]